jgi:hypothetical protein
VYVFVACAYEFVVCACVACRLCVSYLVYEVCGDGVCAGGDVCVCVCVCVLYVYVECVVCVLYVFV